MTGFARHEGQSAGTSWVWEFRSVNGKGLDVRLRLPPGFESIEPIVRKKFQNHFSRGNIQANLSVSRGDALYLPSVNEPMLEAILNAVHLVESKTDLRQSSAAEILAVRGVLETSDAEANADEIAQLHKSVLAGLDDAIVALAEHRQTEGKSLATILAGQLKEITSLTEKVEVDPAHSVDAVRERLASQVSALMDSNVELNQDRLHQEAAILATKADIREEIDRLKAHVDAAQDLLEAGSPVGRKLEFLAQEFNREANTLCSKSNAVSITETGLALKVVIDQFREQILNVE